MLEAVDDEADEVQILKCKTNKQTNTEKWWVCRCNMINIAAKGKKKKQK